MSWSTYFTKVLDWDKDRPAMEPRSSRCPSCPIDCMYEEIAEALSKESPDTIRAMSEKWFCHTSPQKACRGNWDYQGLQ